MNADTQSSVPTIEVQTPQGMGADSGDPLEVGDWNPVSSRCSVFLVRSGSGTYSLLTWLILLIWPAVAQQLPFLKTHLTSINTTDKEWLFGPIVKF